MKTTNVFGLITGEETVFPGVARVSITLDDGESLLSGLVWKTLELYDFFFFNNLLKKVWLYW